MPEVYSCRAAHQRIDPIPADAVYVGRRMAGHPDNPWGNPNKLQWESDRGHNITLFWEYAIERLQREPTWLDPLRGKDLVCWCHTPTTGIWPCHADVLLWLAGDRRCVACSTPIAICELHASEAMRCPECRALKRRYDAHVGAPPVQRSAFDGPIRGFTLMPKRGEER